LSNTKWFINKAISLLLTTYSSDVSHKASSKINYITAWYILMWTCYVQHRHSTKMGKKLLQNGKTKVGFQHH